MNNSSMKWKAALWERQSIEPAMLRVPIVFISFLFLWTINLWILDRNRVQYQTVLPMKAAPSLIIFIWSIILFSLYAINMVITANFFKLNVEYGISIYYLIFTLLYCVPNIPGFELRNASHKLFKLVVLIPKGSNISFGEVLLADALTSLSKVFKDFGVTLIAIYAQLRGVNIESLHEIGMILVAIFASYPYFIRIQQCWVQYEASNDSFSRTGIFINMIKYASAFPPIWLAATASLGYFHPYLPTFVAAMATFNSLISFSWDIVMDWGLISITRDKRYIIRQRFLWPLPTYFFAVIINLLLRFSWIANRLPFFDQLNSSHLVLMIEIAEIFRRSMWNLYRIEWEVIVNQDRLDSEKDDTYDNLPLKS